MKSFIIAILSLLCVVSTNAQNDKVVSEDSFKNHRLIRYSNNTSKFIDGYTDNWVIFRTEYEINEYTGEPSTTPVKLKDYFSYDLISFASRFYNVILVSAEINENGGYQLSLNNYIITISFPSGVKCRLNADAKINEMILKRISNGNAIISCLDAFFKTPDSEITFVGPYGNILEKLSDDFNNSTWLVGYNNDKSGVSYYDKLKHRIYSYNNKRESVFQVCSTTNEDVNQQDKKNLYVINTLPNDSITRFVHNEMTGEIYYSNNDYIKYSELKKGEIFDCVVHRPNGLFTITLKDNSPVVEFVYSQGDYSGYTYSPYNNDNPYTFKSILGQTKIVYPRKSDKFYNPKTKKTLSFVEEGKMYDMSTKKDVYFGQKLKEFQAHERQKTAIYQAYCKKYGKANVDEIVKKNNIKVGMPISVIKELCYWKPLGEVKGGQSYSIFCAGTSYDLANKKIVAEYPLFAANQWTVLVSGGVVKSLRVVR